MPAKKPISPAIIASLQRHQARPQSAFGPGLKGLEALFIEGLRAKRAYIAFLANFHFLQDQANFWQTDLF